MSLERSISPVSYHFSSDNVSDSRPFLGGAIDVICLHDISNPSSILSCSPFWVQFGTISFRKACGRTVFLEINGIQTGIPLLLDANGVAAFYTDIPPETTQTEQVIPEPSSDEDVYQNQVSHDRLSPPETVSSVGDLLITENTLTPFSVNPCAVESVKNKSARMVWGKSGKYLPSCSIMRYLSKFLQPGPNRVKYYAMSRDFPKSREPRSSLGGFIYLWPAGRRAVVFDVDGTITSSDTFGFIFPSILRMGKFQRKGIVAVANYIVQQGYLPIYLTMRGSALAGKTRKYLQRVVSEHHKRLPYGPVVTCSRGIIDSSAVSPAEYKAFALKSMSKSLNRVGLDVVSSPLFIVYGGFGNRDTDQQAYLETGIHSSRIFYFSSRITTEDNGWRDYRELFKSGYLAGAFPLYVSEEEKSARIEQLEQ
ncbi:hypothetical protein GEMRC1_002278 [Eukaryota sp. GEM-RC1]